MYDRFFAETVARRIKCCNEQRIKWCIVQSRDVRLSLSLNVTNLGSRRTYISLVGQNEKERFTLKLRDVCARTSLKLSGDEEKTIRTRIIHSHNYIVFKRNRVCLREITRGGGIFTAD